MSEILSVKPVDDGQAGPADTGPSGKPSSHGAESAGVHAPRPKAPVPPRPKRPSDKKKKRRRRSTARYPKWARAIVQPALALGVAGAFIHCASLLIR